MNLYELNKMIECLNKNRAEHIDLIEFYERKKKELLKTLSDKCNSILNQSYA